MIAAIHQKWDVSVMKGNLFGEAKANQAYLGRQNANTQ